MNTVGTGSTWDMLLFMSYKDWILILELCGMIFLVLYFLFCFTFSYYSYQTKLVQGDMTLHELWRNGEDFMKFLVFWLSRWGTPIDRQILWRIGKLIVWHLVLMLKVKTLRIHKNGSWNLKIWTLIGLINYVIFY